MRTHTDPHVWDRLLSADPAMFATVLDVIRREVDR